jgi:putative transposase
MPSKKHKPGQIIGKLREVEIVLGLGGTTAEACRRIAVSAQTYYRWRKEYGGLKTDQARRMKDLEKENLRLRRAIFFRPDARQADLAGGCSGNF